MDSNYPYWLIELFTEPRSCLFITGQGELQRIYCPFAVLCISDSSKLYQGFIYSVEAVREGLDRKILYEIEGRVHHHVNFRLLHTTS